MMNYNFKTGQIILVGSEEPISTIIQKADKCDISHAATVFNEKFVVDARGDFPNNTVAMRSIQDLLDRSTTVYVLTPRCDYQHVAKVALMQDFLRKQIGKKYDYGNTTIVQLMRLVGLKKIFQVREARAMRKWQCAEITACGAKKVYDYFYDWPKIAVSPKIIKFNVNYKIEKIK